MDSNTLYLTADDIEKIENGKQVTKNGYLIVYEKPKPKTREDLVAERRADMPPKYRAIYDRAVSGQSLRAAINSFCLECIGWEYKEIRNCTCLECPLHAVRPYQRKLKASETGGSDKKMAVTEGSEES